MARAIAHEDRVGPVAGVVERRMSAANTEIEVTNKDGRTKTFKPGPDQIAEAFIHEIGIHAGRITAGQSDVHDGSAVIREVSEQIGGFFRTAGDSGDLELGQTSKDISKFVGAR